MERHHSRQIRMAPRPDKLETIRIIQQIARHGEQMLKK
jgi:hypothetical protein